jgi:serine/threonine-protein kinase
MHEEVSEGWGAQLGLDLEPGTQLAGFTLEARLATGGSGTVYLASRGGQRVALKVVPRNDWGEREVDALRRVRHARVVGLLGYGLWPEQHPRYLVLILELVEGLPLEAWAHEHNPSARRLVEGVVLPLTRALGQVHAAGVVHRDVKESNVVMRSADGLPVLVDFGAARYQGAPRLTERLPPGTREYRSPELLRFAREWEGDHYPAAPADDLWALGVTLYWLLTRQLPFGDRGGELVKRILEQVPRPVHELNPRVPVALGEVCQRMLEKHPLARYPDAQALVQALEEAVARGDDTWEVPLFPPEPQPSGQRARPPDPPPTLQEPAGQETRARRAWPGAWRVLLLGVVGVLAWKVARGPGPWVDCPPTPRVESPAPLPPAQVTNRQEIAAAPTTDEVRCSAGPPRSSPTALVAQATHPEETPVPKSHPSRSPLAATLLAGSLCVGPGCASAPQPVGGPPPAPIPCPAGAAQTYKIHNTETERFIMVLFERAPNGAGVVRKGEVLRVQVVGKWGDFPNRTPLLGRAWFGRDRVYGRLTQVLLPSGESLPICLDLDFNGPGVPMDPDSTPTVAFVNKSSGARMVPESMKE